MSASAAPVGGAVNVARRSLAEFVHRQVRGSRDSRVIEGVCALAPPARSMLDVGCSDGRIAAADARRSGYAMGW
jgi:hypothetical protein